MSTYESVRRKIGTPAFLRTARNYMNGKYIGRSLWSAVYYMERTGVKEAEFIRYCEETVLGKTAVR